MRADGVFVEFNAKPRLVGYPILAVFDHGAVVDEELLSIIGRQCPGREFLGATVAEPPVKGCSP
jgi:hypothetical protein